MNIQTFDLLYSLQNTATLSLKLASRCFGKDIISFSQWLTIHKISLETIENYFKNYDLKNFILINNSIPLYFNIGDNKNTTSNLFKEENRLLFRSARTNLILCLIRKILYHKYLEISDYLKRMKVSCLLQIFIIEKEEEQNV